MYERHGSHDPARLETFLEWSTIRALGEPANASPEPAAWWSGGGVGKVGEVGRSYGSHDDFPGAEAVAGPRTTAYASTRTLAPSRPYAVSSRTERPFKLHALAHVKPLTDDAARVAGGAGGWLAGWLVGWLVGGEGRSERAGGRMAWPGVDDKTVWCLEQAYGDGYGDGIERHGAVVCSCIVPAVDAPLDQSAVRPMWGKADAIGPVRLDHRRLSRSSSSRRFNSPSPFRSRRRLHNSASAAFNSSLLFCAASCTPPPPGLHNLFLPPLCRGSTYGIAIPACHLGSTLPTGRDCCYVLTYSAGGHVANQALKQTCTMDSRPKCKPGSWKKNGTGGDVQLTAHDNVAPWAVAVFVAIGRRRCPAAPAVAGRAMQASLALASWLTFLREPGAPSLRSSVSRDACGNGCTHTLTLLDTHTPPPLCLSPAYYTIPTRFVFAASPPAPAAAAVSAPSPLAMTGRCRLTHAHPPTPSRAAAAAAAAKNPPSPSSAWVASPSGLGGGTVSGYVCVVGRPSIPSHLGWPPANTCTPAGAAVHISFRL
ncbi:hypothetical protein J3E71DRAFT_372449 [Bipolaris maydis]|nr:hypothetical protein J3E71DRAFT_372449 [Bipolaris maydis]